MTYRDELEAERARIEALEGENKRLRADLERAHETPAAPKPAAPVAAGVVTKRAAIKSAVIAVLGFGAVLVGFGVLLVVTRTRIHGVVTASGGKLGTWTMTPDSCQSGQRNQFRGVSFFSSKDSRLGVTFVDPVGGESTISINMLESTKARRFDASDCKVLDGNMQRQNSSTNNIRDISGFVKFDCTLGDEHATGNVTFEYCH